MERFEDFLQERESILDDEGLEFAAEVEFVPERDAFNRAGISRGDEILRTLIGSSGSVPSKLEELNKRLYRQTISPEDKFKIFVSVFFEKFKETLNMNESDFSSLIF